MGLTEEDCQNKEIRPKTPGAPVHLFTQQLGEAAENLGRLLLGEGVLAVADTRQFFPFVPVLVLAGDDPEVRHNGTRAACGVSAAVADVGVPCCASRQPLRCAASTCNAMALCAALCLESLPWGSKGTANMTNTTTRRRLEGGGWDGCPVRGHAAGGAQLVSASGC